MSMLSVHAGIIFSKINIILFLVQSCRPFGPGQRLLADIHADFQLRLTFGFQTIELSAAVAWLFGVAVVVVVVAVPLLRSY